MNAPEVPTIHADDRGRLAEILRRDKIGRDIRQLYLVTVAPRKHRADHYHLKKTEWVCALQGSCRVELLVVATGERSHVDLSDKDWAVLEIPPGVHHIMRNEGEREILLLVSADKEHDPADPDVYRLNAR